MFLLYLTLMLAIGNLLANDTESKSNSKPNIILILTDDLGFETLTCNGGQSYHTPDLYKMAETSIRFTNCFASPL